MDKSNYYELVLKPLYDYRKKLRENKNFVSKIKLLILKRKINKKEKEFCKL